MKKIVFIFFVLIVTKLYNAPCPEEDYPNIKYGDLESLDDICLAGIPGVGSECDNCCLTVYYYKRWIASEEYLDVMIDYVSPHESSDCYLCYRKYADAIITYIHKKILQRHADEYSLQGRRTYPHHLTMRAGCDRHDFLLGYRVRCSVEDSACCYKGIEIEMDNDGNFLNYLHSWGTDYYSNPPICIPPCQIRCGFVGNLNLFASHPRFDEGEPKLNEINKVESDNLLNNSGIVRIFFEECQDDDLLIEIVDITGIRLSSFKIIKNKNDIFYDLNIENLPIGLYYIRIITNRNTKTIKLLKLNDN